MLWFTSGVLQNRIGFEDLLWGLEFLNKYPLSLITRKFHVFAIWVYGQKRKGRLSLHNHGINHFLLIITQILHNFCATVSWIFSSKPYIALYLTEFYRSKQQSVCIPRSELPAAQHDSLKSQFKAIWRQRVNVFIDLNEHWIRIKDYFNNEFSITLYFVGSIESICLISLPHQENIMRPQGWTEAWQLISLPYSSFSGKASKWPLAHRKINSYVTFHAAVVVSVYFHMLSRSIASCLLKVWACIHISLGFFPSSEDKVFV